MNIYELAIPEPNSGCWLWEGAVNPDGYGYLRIARKLTGAHRASWADRNGPIPSGMHVLHRCDVRSCVNPDHLFLGTHADNMADRAAKGRTFFKGKPSKNPQAKLTWEMVDRIRATIGVVSKRKMAKEMGVSAVTIFLVRTNRAWKEEFRGC